MKRDKLRMVYRAFSKFKTKFKLATIKVIVVKARSKLDPSLGLFVGLRHATSSGSAIHTNWKHRSTFDVQRSALFLHRSEEPHV